MTKNLPAELGDLIEVHRPMRGYTGWIPVLLPGTVFGVMYAVMNPGPLIGLLIFVGFSLPMLYGTGEWFLLEHRFYRHGMVFRSLVPGLATYVVPYATCDPDTFDTIGRRVHDGSDLTKAIGRRFRQCPATATNILLVGLKPYHAKNIGSGKLTWERALGVFAIPDIVPGIVTSEQWLFSSRTPEHHIALLRDLITTEKSHARPGFWT